MQQIRTIKRVIYYDGHSGAGYLLRIELRSVSQAFIAFCVIDQFHPRESTFVFPRAHSVLLICVMVDMQNSLFSMCSTQSISLQRNVLPTLDRPTCNICIAFVV